MEKKPGIKAHLIFWILTLAIASALLVYLFISPDLADSDGIVYAAIARNIAEGVGSFWQPEFTKYHLSHFYDHPALGFGILSWFYRLLGDHGYVEKIYSAVITLLNALIMYAIAKRIVPALRWYSSWFLYLLWLLLPINIWYFASNMLEPVAGMFGLLAIYCLLVSYQLAYRGLRLWLCLLIAALATTIGLYVNGILVLYVCMTEWCLFLAFRHLSFSRSLMRWSLFMLLIIVCFVSFTPAHHNFIMYLKKQLIPALSGRRFNDLYAGWYRLNIVILSVRGAWILLFASLGLWFYFRMKATARMKQDATFLILMLYFSLFPLVISEKQTMHYAIHTNYFYTLLAFVCLASGIFERVEGIQINKWRFKCFAIAMTLLLVIVLATDTYLSRQYNISDSHSYREQAVKIANQVGYGSTIGVVEFLVNPTTIESYLQRYAKINLQHQSSAKHCYVLVISDYPFKLPSYRRIRIGLTDLRLYRRKDCYEKGQF